MLQKLNEAADYIRSKLQIRPEIALVLGTGLGDFAAELTGSVVIPYADIPHFPVSTAPYHKGQLVAGELAGKPVLIMQGRFHYYEGYTMEQAAFPVRVFCLLGIKTLILTNAVGAINTDYRVGDLMMIEDHIKFFNDSPLRGSNLDSFGPRFNDMSNAYTKKLRDLAREIAETMHIPLKEGVYAYMPGPSYETPAEIRMLRTLGADVVGMSTVPEVLAAAHAGMQIFGLSFCVNMAAGIEKEITHIGFSKAGIEHFTKLMCKMIKDM
ncbi:MAG: purine-nucleoside phosphorylase [Ruminococcaceae bacterium]|nr:purine-nucleoside phosphorylase [Oscillospiraceae bacterium]